MIITSVNGGDKAPYSTDGTKLTIGEVTVDLANRQRDEQQVVYLSLDNTLQQIVEGIGAWYVAIVLIPPKQYDLVDSGEKDEQGNAILKKQDRPLDMDDVELRLWGLPGIYHNLPKSDEEEQAEQAQTGEGSGN